MESGGGGGCDRVGLVRRLLEMLLIDCTIGPHKRFTLCDDAIAGFRAQAADGSTVSDEAANPSAYSVAFGEREMAKAVNCPPDELHSALAHLAYRTRGQIVLFSHFPTKIKLRFFGRTPMAELLEQDPLLRKVLPLA